MSGSNEDYRGLWALCQTRDQMRIVTAPARFNKFGSPRAKQVAFCQVGNLSPGLLRPAQCEQLLHSCCTIGCKLEHLTATERPLTSTKNVKIGVHETGR